MGILGSLAKGTLKTSGSFMGWGLSTNPGRVATGALGGGLLNVATGDSTYNAGDRFVFGAMAGGALGVGFNIGTSRKIMGGMASSVYNAGARGVSSQVSRSNLYYSMGRAGGGSRTQSALRSADVSMTQAFGNAPTSIVNSAGTVAGIGIGAAAIGGMGMAAHQVNESNRRRRVGRFQQSTHGMVQGMHSGRHR